jgi:uncharacterized protein YceH (UPF0502 family)
MKKTRRNPVKAERETEVQTDNEIMRLKDIVRNHSVSAVATVLRADHFSQKSLG